MEILGKFPRMQKEEQEEANPTDMHFLPFLSFFLPGTYDVTAEDPAASLCARGHLKIQSHTLRMTEQKGTGVLGP